MSIVQTYTSDGPVSGSSETHPHPSTHKDHTEPHKDCKECANLATAEVSRDAFPPSVSEQLAEQTPRYIPRTAQGAGVVADYHPKYDEVEVSPPADSDSAPYPKPGMIVDQVTDYSVIKPYFDGVIKPNLKILLAMVLGDIDASIPNKDQNKAVKNLIRRQFDEQMLEMQRMWVQRSHYGTTEQYLLKPDPA